MQEDPATAKYSFAVAEAGDRYLLRVSAPRGGQFRHFCGNLPTRCGGKLLPEGLGHGLGNKADGRRQSPEGAQEFE